MNDLNKVQPMNSEGTRKKNGMATASLVLGIIAIPTGLFFIGQVLGILAIIFGIVAIINYKKDRAIGGQGKAIAGIATGSIGICMIIVTLLAALAIPRFVSASRKARVTLAKETLKEIYTAQQDFYEMHGYYTPPAEDIFGEGSPPEGLILEYPLGSKQRFKYDILEGGVARARPDLEVDPKLKDISPIIIDESGRILGGLED
ncbi:DUF4190 domain-containing protein [bacterium]|nr:DUF4190 domain-containing protein [bacterium]